MAHTPDKYYIPHGTRWPIIGSIGLTTLFVGVSNFLNGSGGAGPWLAWAGTVPFTISYDPGSTQLQILVGISIVAGFLTARLGGPASLKPIAMATVTSAVLIGLVGLAHQATGLDMVFGIYSPRFSAPRLLTPLMNGNHLGGFSLMGALIAAGLAAQPDSRWKHLWTGASVLCAIIVAWTASRGAIGSLLFGFVLLGAWLIDEKRSDRRRAAIPGTDPR